MSGAFVEQIDWMFCEWRGVLEEEEDYILVPLEGPLEREGTPLGCLWVPACEIQKSKVEWEHW
jgi:hypothetical protein